LKGKQSTRVPHPLIANASPTVVDTMSRRIPEDVDTGMDNIQTDDVSVYFTYDIHNPPPKPSNEGQWKWTRFICISDTHCNRFKVPPGDVLLHAGDLTHTVREYDAKRARSLFSFLPIGKTQTNARYYELAQEFASST
jgi:hypothetical protein